MSADFGKPISYWKSNAEEDYIKTPISVLKYISILETILNQLKSDKERESETLCCAACFKEIPENHFEFREYHDHEHCPNCGNDFLDNKWFSSPIRKEVCQKIKEVLGNENRKQEQENNIEKPRFE